MSRIGLDSEMGSNLDPQSANTLAELKPQPQPDEQNYVILIESFSLKPGTTDLGYIWRH